MNLIIKLKTLSILLMAFVQGGQFDPIFLNHNSQFPSQYHYGNYHQNHRRHKQMIHETVDTKTKAFQNDEENFANKSTFFLKCPEPTEAQWENKINFTVEWTRDDVSFLQIIKKNKFPCFDISSKILKKATDEHTKVGKRLLRKWLRSTMSPLISVQQWPSLDGQSASAIIYFTNRFLTPEAKLNEKQSHQNIYKFEVEERRKWFALRITNPMLWKNKSLWRCNLKLVTKRNNTIGLNDEQDGIVAVEMESRKVLTDDTQTNPIIQFKKSMRRKARMNLRMTKQTKPDKATKENIIKSQIIFDEENDEDEDNQRVKHPIIFSKIDDEFRTFRRQYQPHEVSFTRGKETVEYIRNNIRKSSNSLNYEPFLQPDNSTSLTLAGHSNLELLQWSLPKTNQNYWWQYSEINCSPMSNICSIFSKRFVCQFVFVLIFVYL